MASEHQKDFALDMTRTEREQRVVRSVYLIQHAQYTLSLSEQRFLLYCISKVKPDDTTGKLYEIELKDYLQVCGLRGTTSYSAIKEQIVETMRQMVLGMEETDEKGRKTFTVFNWFSKMTITQGTGVVRFSFTPDIAQHLIGLAQYNAHADKANQLYYISDELKYMLPFKCRYSYYLYPLLRSHQNRNEWTFPIDELRQKLDVYERMDNPSDYRQAFDPKSSVTRKPIHARFADFRRSVLDPAVADINNYSNIKCAYRPEKRGQTVVAVTFIFEDKTETDRAKAEQRGMLVLDRTDEFTQRINGRVPDPENPLEFSEAFGTGPDTNPPSKYVKAKSKKEVDAERIETVRNIIRMQQMQDGIFQQETTPPKPVNFGKRGARAANKAFAELEVDRNFPLDRTAKNGTYLWLLENMQTHSERIGGNYGEWMKTVTPDEFANFIRFAVNNFGAERLRLAKNADKLRVVASDDAVSVVISGKTTALDMSKFVHRVFGDRDELLKIFAAYCDDV